MYYSVRECAFAYIHIIKIRHPIAHPTAYPVIPDIMAAIMPIKMVGYVLPTPFILMIEPPLSIMFRYSSVSSTITTYGYGYTYKQAE